MSISPFPSSPAFPVTRPFPSPLAFPVVPAFPVTTGLIGQPFSVLVN